MKPHFIFNYTYSSTLCSVLKFSTTMFKGPFCALATSEKLQEDLRSLFKHRKELMRSLRNLIYVGSESKGKRASKVNANIISRKRINKNWFFPCCRRSFPFSEWLESTNPLTAPWNLKFKSWLLHMASRRTLLGKGEQSMEGFKHGGKSLLTAFGPEHTLTSS